MSIQRLLQLAAAGTGDDDFANVVLLLDGDGTSGDDNNTFTDSSTNGFTVTESGSVVQGSFSPYGDNWSNYFGSGNKLKTAGSSDFAFGTGDFSIDFWMNCESFSSVVGFINTQTNDGSGSAGMWYLRADNSTTLQFGRHGANEYVTGATSFSVNTWHHIHVSRVSSTVRLFVDGTSLTLTAVGGGVDTYDFNSNGTNLTVGFAAANDPMPGYMSNVRVIKGTSSENKTSNFTPPTEPLTAVTNTVLLTCQSNRFVDNSSSSHTFSVDGTPKVAPFSPFKDDDARDITTDGGSMYGDGSNSYLTVADNADFDFGTGDFTVSGWFYKDSATNNMSIIDGRSTGNTTGWIVYERNDSKLDFWHGSSLITSASTLSPNQWYYFHISRSGSSLAMYINGASSSSATNTTSLVSHGLNIGAKRATASSLTPFEGYLSDVNIVKGTATSNAVPTSPTASITDTSLLLNFQDAGIYDRSGINNLDTIGNAQIDTAVKKYGTGSMEFDGSGDRLVISDPLAFDLGSSDFTLECWFNARNLDASSNYGFISSYSSTTDFWTLRIQNTSNWGIQFRVYEGSDLVRIEQGSDFTTNNTWVHVAVTREGNTFRLFKDGTLVNSATYSGSVSQKTTNVIGEASAALTQTMDGFIDDVRITKGIARYTANFTPPTDALPKF